jgi:hypothetical protein
MSERPRDLDDLWLAPVCLQLEDRLTELSGLDAHEMEMRVALDSDLPDSNLERRRTAMLVCLSRNIELHGWSLAWVVRGLRMTHGVHSLVLGLPESVRHYIS